MAEIPKALATGLVDLASGMMLAVKTVDDHPQGVLDLLVPATQEMFEGGTVAQIETLFKKARGVESEERYFQEIFFSSKHHWHYFGRLESQPQIVFAAVTRGDVNLGLLFKTARLISRESKI
jgi:hypothetical protein